MTQTMLAEKLGKASQRVWALEHQAGPQTGLGTLTAVASALGVSVNELIGGNEEVLR